MVGCLFNSTPLQRQYKEALLIWTKSNHLFTSGSCNNLMRQISSYHYQNNSPKRKTWKCRDNLFPCRGNSLSNSILFNGTLNSFVLNSRTLLIQNVPYYPTNYFSTTTSNNNANAKACQKPSSSLTIPQKFVNSFPPHVQPYLKLSRVHQPIGTWLLFWPCTWGLALGTNGLPELSLLALFGTGAFIMRGAGCVVNDMWDRHIDIKVRRTADRPLASGEIRMRHATAWLAVQLSIAFSILLQLNHPCLIVGVGSLGLVTLYPFAKRVTHWPQAVLGMTFNIGVLMGFTATLQHNQLGYLSFPWLDPSCISLYLAGVSWTLIYDTIYAHQDRNDDAVLGLGSTARRFGENTKFWLSGFGCCMISSLTASGILADLSWPFYISVSAVASHLVWQIKTLDINDLKNCSDRFKSNSHIGWIIFLGILGSSILKSSENDVTKKSVIDNNTVPSSVESIGLKKTRQVVL